jgi:hypothetical protein
MADDAARKADENVGIMRNSAKTIGMGKKKQQSYEGRMRGAV